MNEKTIEELKRLVANTRYFGGGTNSERREAFRELRGRGYSWTVIRSDAHGKQSQYRLELVPKGFTASNHEARFCENTDTVVCQGVTPDAAARGLGAALLSGLSHTSMNTMSAKT